MLFSHDFETRNKILTETGIGDFLIHFQTFLDETHLISLI